MTTLVHYLRSSSPVSLTRIVWSMAKKFYSIGLLWYRNYRTRKHLSSLPEHLYDDLGITSEQAQQEYRKSFWK